MSGISLWVGLYMSEKTHEVLITGQFFKLIRPENGRIYSNLGLKNNDLNRSNAKNNNENLIFDFHFGIHSMSNCHRYCYDTDPNF